MPEDSSGVASFTSPDGITSLIILPTKLSQTETLDTIPSVYEQLLKESQAGISVEIARQKRVEIAGQPALQRWYIVERDEGGSFRAMAAFIKIGQLSLTIAAIASETGFAEVEPVLQACLRTLRFPDEEEADREPTFGSVRVTELELRELHALRQDSLKLAVGERAQEFFSKAENTFYRAISELDDAEEAEAAIREAEATYREAIITGLREELLGQIEREIEAGRSDITLEQYEEAKSVFDQIQDGAIAKGEFLESIEKMKELLLCSGQLLADLTIELWNDPDPKSPIRWLSPYPPTDGALTTVSVLVKNVGSKAVDKSFIIRLYVDGKAAKKWTFSPISQQEDKYHAKQPLMPGGTRIYEYTSKFSKGKHTFKWIADVKNDIKEEDESKKSNELEATGIWLEPSNLPDLTVEDISYDGALVCGQEVTWKVSIKNTGGTDITVPFMTSLGSGGIQFEAFWLQSLAKNSSKTFKTKQYVSIVDMESITGTVDVGNVIPEKDESDNKKKVDFTTSYVDLAVADPVVVKTQNPIHEPVTISFTIQNKGSGDITKPFKIAVYPGKVVQQSDYVGAQWLTQPYTFAFPMGKLPLKAGKSLSLQHKVALFYPGDYQAWVMADFPDPDFVYKEKDKANNTRTSSKFSVKETYCVKIKKVEHEDSCKNSLRVWLDRSTGYWKGPAVLNLMHQSKVIDKRVFPPNPASLDYGYGILNGEGINPNSKKKWVAKAKVVAYAMVGGKLTKSPAPEKTIDLWQYPLPKLTSISPTSGERGGKTSVTIKGENFPSSAKVNVGDEGIIQDPQVGVKVKKVSSNEITAEFEIDSRAFNGKRLVRVSSACATSNKLPFEVKGSSDYQSDLSIDSLWIKPKTPNRFSKFRFLFSSSNLGAEEAPASKAKAVLDGGIKWKVFDIPAVKVGKSFTCIWEFPSGLPDGSHKIKVYLDHDGKIKEQNESNNTKSMTFSVVWW
jgi:hypothetical protein